MKRTINNQDGFVSILVTIIILLIISLITVGFAQLARREQNQALDRQLSVEADYAAESGINDAIDATKKALALGHLPPTSNNCVSLINSNAISSSPVLKVPPALESVLSITGQSQYTCVIIDNSPTSLEYSSVGQQKSAAYANITTSSNINELVFGWNLASNSVNATFPPGPAFIFSKYPAWAGTSPPQAPVLRVDITNLEPGFDRTSLTNNTFTGFFYPLGNAAAGAYGITSFASGQNQQRGIIVSGECNNSRPSPNAHQPQACNVSVTGINSKHLFIRVTSIYGSSKVSVLALDSIPSRLDIKGAQTIIDVTGKAANVVKRQQARVSPVSNVLPAFGVETVDSICKRLLTAPAPGTTSTDQTDTACIP